MKSILIMVPTFLFDVIDNCGFPKELSTFIIVDSKGLYVHCRRKKDWDVDDV